MADKKPKSSSLTELLRNLKIKYLNGQNPIGRAQVTHGFMPTKNAATNYGSFITGSPVDERMLIRKSDPMNQLRQVTSGVGRLERIHNTYLQPRVKLAD